MYNITEAFTQKNPRIHSGYMQVYLKIYELFSRQLAFINRVECVYVLFYCYFKSCFFILKAFEIRW
jgi:hypothetical protein